MLAGTGVTCVVVIGILIAISIALIIYRRK